MTGTPFLITGNLTSTERKEKREKKREKLICIAAIHLWFRRAIRPKSRKANINPTTNSMLVRERVLAQIACCFLQNKNSTKLPQEKREEIIHNRGLIQEQNHVRKNVKPAIKIYRRIRGSCLTHQKVSFCHVLSDIQNCYQWLPEK